MKTLSELNNAVDKGYLKAVHVQQEGHAVFKLDFPDPPAGEVWHNPDNLAPEKVGCAHGFRLLTVEEVRLLRDHRGVNTREVECYSNEWDRWTLFLPDNQVPSYTYRVPFYTELLLKW